MCFVWIWEQTAIISLYSINWLVCITEMECLLRGADWVYMFQFNFRVSAADRPNASSIVASTCTRSVAPYRTVSCDIWPLWQDPHCLFTCDCAAGTVFSPLISLCGHILLLQTEVRTTCLSQDVPYAFYNPGIARGRTTRHFNTHLTSHHVPGFRSFREVPKRRAVSFVTSDCMSAGESSALFWRIFTEYCAGKFH